MTLATAVAAAGLAGCSAGTGRDGARSGSRGARAGAKAGTPSRAGAGAATAADRGPGGKASTDLVAEGPRSPSVATGWESFRATRAALAHEIEARAARLKSGPVGNGAVELAALRLADSAFVSLDHGSLGAALGVAQKAVSMWGSNGYAYEVLAYVHLVEGRRDDAAEFAALAARHLPREAPVRAELEGLRRSVEQGSPAR